MSLQYNLLDDSVYEPHNVSQYNDDPFMGHEPPSAIHVYNNNNPVHVEGTPQPQVQPVIQPQFQPPADSYLTAEPVPMQVQPTPIIQSARAPINISKFSGYYGDDGDNFLSNFHSYLSFNNIQEDQRKAALHLHLQGPALVWFQCLNTDQKDTFETLVTEFKRRFVSQSNPALISEAAIFDSLTLGPNQRLEDFYGLICQKGKKINKLSRDLLAQFLKGMPQQLQFFVRASNPENISKALHVAMTGESVGYRVHPQVAAMRNTVTKADLAPVEPIKALTDEVRQLTSLVTQLATGNTQRASSVLDQQAATGPGAAVCFSCNGRGHQRRFCNWYRQYPADSNQQCQLCTQFGHQAGDCYIFNNSGNGRAPRASTRKYNNQPSGGHIHVGPKQ